jgi:hypothetical protein
VGRLAHDGQHYTASTQFEVSDTDVDNLALTLRPGVQVAGQIFIEPGDVPPAQFSLEQLRVNLTFAEPRHFGVPFYVAPATTRPQTDGSFLVTNVVRLGLSLSVAGLPPGAYVSAARYGSADALSAIVEPSDEDYPLLLQIGFRPGRVEGTVTDNRGQPFIGALCALVPAARDRIELYRSMVTDQYGKFVFENIVPGDYTLLAWEDIPAGAHQDAEYVRRFEPRGQAVRVEKSGSQVLQVRVIPVNP